MAAMTAFATGVFCCTCVALPLIGFQIYGYHAFCHHGYLPPRPWCDDDLPRIYTFVQQYYWGVGIFKYWRVDQVICFNHQASCKALLHPELTIGSVEQIPNFFLAAPVLLLAAAGVLEYAAANFRFILSGGFAYLAPFPKYKHTASPSPFLSPNVAVHIYPWCFMACVSLIVMHVQVSCSSHHLFHHSWSRLMSSLHSFQVSTRFLSSCPAQYWYLAHILSENGSSVAARRRWKIFVWGMSITYTVIGSLLLPNFYPWT